MAIGPFPVPNYTLANQPNVMQQYGQMLSLRNLAAQQKELPLDLQIKQQEAQQAQSQTQVAQVQATMAQQQLASQKAMIDALSDPSFMKDIGTEGTGPRGSGLGFDPNAMTQGLIKRGVLPQQAIGFTNQLVDRSAKVSEAAKNNASAVSETAGAYQKGMDALSQKMSDILDLPTDKAIPAFNDLKQYVAQGGVPGMSPQDQALFANSTLDHLPAFINLSKIESQIAGYHKTQADALASEAKATTAQTEAAQEKAGATAQQETARYIQIKHDEALGQKPSKDDLAFASAYEQQKTLGQRYLIESGGNLSAGALDDLATAYHETGTLPQTGFGAAGTAMRAAIINHAHEMFGDQQLAANSAAFKANEKSLDNLQKQYDQVNAFESTAGKNLGLFLNSAQKIVDSGSPWINKPLRSVAAGGLGSEDLAAFNAARQTAVNEIAKVLNSANATGVLSDQARKEVDQLIGPDATFRQVVSASKILQQDMQNRHDSYLEQISDIRSRLAPQAAQPNAPAAQPAVQVPAAVQQLLSKAGPGIHTLSDGSQWMTGPNGEISPYAGAKQ
jgi:hypothetical protein